MLANNPFINITSSGNEKVIDRVKERVELQVSVNDALYHGKIIILKGRPGVGKSTLIHSIIKDVGRTNNIDVVKEDFTPSIYNKLRTLTFNPARRSLIVLDDFNNVELLDKNSQIKVLNLMDELAQRMAMLLVENRDEGVEKDFKKLGKKFEKHEIGGLPRDDLRQVILDRLNMVRPIPRKSLEPFTEEEYNKIFKKSGGNPRIALLICSALYDQKQSNLI